MLDKADATINVVERTGQQKESSNSRGREEAAEPENVSESSQKWVARWVQWGKSENDRECDGVIP